MHNLIGQLGLTGFSGKVTPPEIKHIITIRFPKRNVPGREIKFINKFIA